MRNHSVKKCNKKMTRYRTPSRFIMKIIDARKHRNTKHKSQTKNQN